MHHCHRAPRHGGPRLCCGPDRAEPAGRRESSRDRHRAAEAGRAEPVRDPTGRAGRANRAQRGAHPAKRTRLIDGALAAPGADKDSQTVPAKFSAKNDAEDHLPIPAFAFKHLSDEQKRVIVESVKDAKTAPPKGTAPAEAYAKVSMKLPSSADLRALPDSVLAQMPEMEGYSYATVGNKVLLVRY